MSSRWTVVVPVKLLPLAKSRLRAAVPPGQLAELALAFAVDTVTAAVAASGVDTVLVVSDDPAATRRLRDLGALVVRDTPAAGLNPALRHGAAVAARRSPECGVAALSADLPALRPAELDEALTAAARHPRGVVADTPGTGTTLLTARAGTQLRPAYGEGSSARHRDGGAVELGVAVPGLRRDVDTAADLAEALALGVGAHTAGLLAGAQAAELPGARRRGVGGIVGDRPA